MFSTTHASLLSFSFLSNVKRLSDQLHSSEVDITFIPSFNYSKSSSVDIEEYSAWFKQYGSKIPGNLTDCDLEKEMQKVKAVGLL